MGAPSINISFIEKALTAIKRGERGIVLVLVKDDVPAGANNPITIVMEKEIPSVLKDTTKDQIKLALKGYLQAPLKVLVYCMEIDDSATNTEVDDGYSAALDALETVRFDYLAIPTVKTDGKCEAVATWIKDMREKKQKKIKAVLPSTDADTEGVINFTTAKNVKTDSVTDEDGNITYIDTKYTAEQYCARVAGLIAGTPLDISCSFAPMPELSDCTRLNDIHTPVDNGEFIVFYDGEKVKVVRGVNSLMTLTSTKGKSFKKIKIVEAMDMIYDDIKKAVQDNYIGKYANSYDNKCLLVVAIREYFGELKKAGILSNYSVEIDLEEQTDYLKKKGQNTAEMSEKEILEADTGSEVFLIAHIKILDAMEDIHMPIYI